jgi:protein involved in polysaccharide export with SLBB domain
LALTLALALPGCLTTSGSLGIRTAERPPTVDLSLGPADVFDVRVYGEPELSSTYRVANDGSIQFPLIGAVDVKGKLPAQVAKDIEERLLAYLKHPQVNVFVKETNSKKITIYGQVRNPGTINYVEAMTIAQAISVVGGLNALAARDRTRVTRARDGKTETLQVNLKEVTEGNLTFYLQPGDEIFVPERVF